MALRSSPALVTTCDGLPALGIAVASGACRDGARLRAAGTASSAPGPDSVSGVFTGSHLFDQVLALPPSDFGARRLVGVQVLTDGESGSAEAAVAAMAGAKPLARFEPGPFNQVVRSSAGGLMAIGAVLAVAAMLASAAVAMTAAEGSTEHAGGGRRAAVEAGIPLLVAVVPGMLAALGVAGVSGVLLAGEVTLRLTVMELAWPVGLAFAAWALATVVATRGLPGHKTAEEEP